MNAIVFVFTVYDSTVSYLLKEKKRKIEFLYDDLEILEIRVLS